MDVYSWFRRSVSRPKKTDKPSLLRVTEEEEEEEERLGVTDRLIDFVKTFTLETFKNFPLQDEEGANSDDETPANTGNVRKDLSEWQEQHATLVLSKVKEMSQLRFRLCPRYMKEQHFWRIYFTLVKSYVAQYELHAIQSEMLRQIASEKENSMDTSACEVEMSETKQATSVDPSVSSGHNSDSFTHNIGSGKE